MSALFTFLSFIAIVGAIVFYTLHHTYPQIEQVKPGDKGIMNAIDSAKNVKNLEEIRERTEIQMGGK